MNGPPPFHKPKYPTSSVNPAVPAELYSPHPMVRWATPPKPADTETLKVTDLRAFGPVKLNGVKSLVTKLNWVLAGMVKVTEPPVSAPPPTATFAVTRLPLVSYELQCNWAKAGTASVLSSSVRYLRFRSEVLLDTRDFRVFIRFPKRLLRFGWVAMKRQAQLRSKVRSTTIRGCFMRLFVFPSESVTRVAIASPPTFCKTP